MRANMSPHYVYIVECSDGTFYTGWTTDVEHRLAVHNRGVGAKYTRSRLPVQLRLTEEFQTKSEALRRELQIKKMSREQKQHLIENTP